MDPKLHFRLPLKMDVTSFLRIYGKDISVLKHLSRFPSKHQCIRLVFCLYSNQAWAEQSWLPIDTPLCWYSQPFPEAVSSHWLQPVPCISGTHLGLKGFPTHSPCLKSQGMCGDVEEFLLCTLSVAFRVRINRLNAPPCRSKGSMRKASDSHGLLPSRKPSSLLSLLWHCYINCSYKHASAF